MGEYEELVELGFEGLDKFTDKYHDNVYDHIPAWKRKQKRQEAQQKQQDQQNQQDHQRENRHKQPANENQHPRRDSAAEGNRDINTQKFDKTDRGMSAYAPGAGRDYQDDRDMPYVQDYYRAHNADTYPPRNKADANAARTRDAPQGRTGADGANQPRESSPPLHYGYDPRFGYPDDRGRPSAPSRMRSYSYSPPRSERREKRSSHRHHSKSRERSGSRDGTKTKRLGATLIGALVGGFAGNQSRKGQQYDTAATIGGAVLGGIVAREVAERVGGKKEHKKEKHQKEEKAWEEKYGKDENGDGDSGDGRRRSRDDDRRRR